MRLLLLILLLYLPAPALLAADRYAEPRPGLYTGGTPSPAQLEALAARGVATVIDLRTGDEIGREDPVAVTARSLGMDYVRLPVTGAEDLTPARIEHLRSALDNSRGRVLLHCVDGDRAGALLALMAHQEEGLSRRAALSLGRRAGLSSLEPDVEARMREARWR